MMGFNPVGFYCAMGLKQLRTSAQKKRRMPVNDPHSALKLLPLMIN